MPKIKKTISEKMPVIAVCPECGSDDTELVDWDWDKEKDLSYQYYDCLNCRTTFGEVFKRIRVEVLEKE